MKNSLQTRILSLWTRISVVGMALMCSPVWAQVEELRLPRTKEVPSSPKYLIMAVVIVLLAGMVVVVTLKTKRDHLD